MKKRSIFNRFSAIALGLILLVGNSITSCSEEEIKVSPVEPYQPAAAKVELYISVFDAETNAQLGTPYTQDVTASMGSTILVSSPSNLTEYIGQTINVLVPNVTAGNYTIVPVTFYLKKISSAVEEVISIIPTSQEEAIKNAQDAGLSVTQDTESVDELTKENNSTETIEHEFTYTIQTGYEIISNNKAASRATTEDESIVDKAIETFKKGAGFKDVKVTRTVTIQPNTKVTLNVEQVFTIIETPFTYGECTKTIKVKYAGEVNAKDSSESIGHGHGHGNGANAGGGIGE